MHTILNDHIFIVTLIAYAYILGSNYLINETDFNGNFD